jgi:hypothetical protein
MSAATKRYDEQGATASVFTYKEGLLSAVAHDLALRVSRFSIDVDGADAVRARFEPRSLRVLHAMSGGAPSPGTLSESDKNKIEANLVDDVLEPKRFPEITFTSTSVRPDGEGFLIEGRLTLHGHTEVVRLSARRVGGELVVEHRLHQPTYGIKPYSAMFGALRVQPDVLVRVSLPVSSA